MREKRARFAVGAAPLAATRSVGPLTLAYDDEGDGPPVVCLHAIGHGARDYEEFRARMRKHHRVIALDWPWHGRSSNDVERPTIGRFADVLESFLDSMGIERAVLVGNSIGGGAAIRFASRFPGRVRALVLANPAGLDPPDLVARAAIASVVRMYRAGEARARWFSPAFAAYYRVVLPRAAAHPQRARILEAGLEMAPMLADAWEGFASPEQDLRALGPTITRPTLFAWAMKDAFVQLARNRPAISNFMDYRLETFAAGHSPHLETPDEFCDSFQRFMGEVDALERNRSLAS